MAMVTTNPVMIATDMIDPKLSTIYFSLISIIKYKGVRKDKEKRESTREEKGKPQ